MGNVSYNLSVNAASKIGINKSWTKLHAGNKHYSDYFRVSSTQSVINLTVLKPLGGIVILNNSAITSLKLGFTSGFLPIEVPAGGATILPLATTTTTIYCQTPVADRAIGEFVASEGTNTLSINNHALVVGKIVRFATTGVLPAGLSANTDYFVQSSTPYSFIVSAYPNGSSVDILDQGTGVHTVREVFPVYATYLALQA